MEAKKIFLGGRAGRDASARCSESLHLVFVAPGLPTLSAPTTLFQHGYRSNRQLAFPEPRLGDPARGATWRDFFFCCPRRWFQSNVIALDTETIKLERRREDYSRSGAGTEKPQLLSNRLLLVRGIVPIRLGK